MKRNEEEKERGRWMSKENIKRRKRDRNKKKRNKKTTE